ncbi:universal stress protein [Cellulosimicrobium cellulans]|uniref:universal stress protein n=1 Tax=Cellulosimicrobium cellulans TaxID=1710 RepID=UPI0036E1F657
MTRDDSILVGIDGSDESLHALDWAAAHARHEAVHLHLVSSYLPPGFVGGLHHPYDLPFVDDAYVRRRVEQFLTTAQRRASEAGVSSTTEIATGEPTGVLVARSSAHALVVVGARGAGGLTERLLGTVSSNLPAHSRCPTVVVPSRTGDRADGREPHRTPPESRRIVVGFDGSTGSRSAIDQAIAQARAWRSELVVVRAVPMASWSHSPWLHPGFRDGLLAAARADLTEVVDQLRAAHADVVVSGRAVEGTASAVLIDQSRSADLLVVGARGCGGIRGLLLGSTSQAVLHRAGCPVLVTGQRHAASGDLLSAAPVGAGDPRG